ncbi:MAG: hypothetical protein HYR90_00935 [Candidatus Andersenbacteria bacterium]|nr:hypothetical protein [Candidatus Andersenbacteria bacterium]MBI3251186.1 hypothetical protein [Candidatus Andersenbacteria bacterium]
MKKTNEAASFRAFGREFDRDQAEWLIFSDKRTDIVYAQNTDGLEEIIQYGWRGTAHWTDKELQSELDDLQKENIVYAGKVEENIDIPALIGFQGLTFADLKKILR